MVAFATHARHHVSTHGHMEDSAIKPEPSLIKWFASQHVGGCGHDRDSPAPITDTILQLALLYLLLQRSTVLQRPHCLCINSSTASTKRVCSTTMQLYRSHEQL
jgi:kynurenine formamidase